MRPRACLAHLAVCLAALAAGGRAHADAVPFPVAGLLVDVPRGERWEAIGVAVTDPASDVALDGAVDRLTIHRTDAPHATYRVRIGSRVAPPCGIGAIGPVAARNVGADVWLVAAGRTACWAGPDARVVIEWDADPAPSDAVLAALTTAVRARRIVSPPARLAPSEAPVRLALARSSLAPLSPDDGFRWRSPLDADSPTHRAFDVLVRVVPAFPEAQIQIRRYADETCADRARRLEAGAWVRSGATYLQEVGGFLARAHCHDRADGARDVRLFLAPGADERDFDRILAAIADADPTGPAPRATPGESSSAALLAAASLEAGGSAGGFEAALETDLVWTLANGPFIRLSASLGTFRAYEGVLGVGLRLPHGAFLAVTLGVRFDDLPILHNTSLSGGLEFHTDLLAAHRFAWSLRLVPFHLASALPAVTGAPLVVAWQGVLPSGFTFGATLRWAATPDRASRDWPDTGTMLGATFGWGFVAR